MTPRRALFLANRAEFAGNRPHFVHLNDSPRCADNRALPTKTALTGESGVEKPRRWSHRQGGRRVYFGLMSGTSMDGVDGVAVQFTTGKPPVVLG